MLALLGVVVFALRRRDRYVLLVLLTPIFALFSAHVMLRYHAGYMAARHASVQCLPMTLLAVFGVLVALDRWPRPRALHGAALALLLAISPGFGVLFRASLAHKAVIREAGADLSRLVGASVRRSRRPLLVGVELRHLAYYGGFDYLGLEGAASSSELTRARREGEAYLALYIRTRRPRLDSRIGELVSELGGVEVLAPRFASTNSE